KLARALWPNALQWVFETVRVVGPVQITGDFLAEEAARKRMLFVAAKVDGLAVAHRHDHATSIGAIVGANGPHRFDVETYHSRHPRRGMQSSYVPTAEFAPLPTQGPWWELVARTHFPWAAGSM